jgi:hypothetical protein
MDTQFSYNMIGYKYQFHRYTMAQDENSTMRLSLLFIISNSKFRIVNSKQDYSFRIFTLVLVD